MTMHGRIILIIHGVILKQLKKRMCLSFKPMLSRRCTPAAAGSQVQSGQAFDIFLLSFLCMEMG